MLHSSALQKLRGQNLKLISTVFFMFDGWQKIELYGITLLVENLQFAQPTKWHYMEQRIVNHAGTSVVALSLWRGNLGGKGSTKSQAYPMASLP